MYETHFQFVSVNIFRQTENLYIYIYIYTVLSLWRKKSISKRLRKVGGCRNEEIITIIITNKKVSSLQKQSLFNDKV